MIKDMLHLPCELYVVNSMEKKGMEWKPFKEIEFTKSYKTENASFVWEHFLQKGAITELWSCNFFNKMQFAS